MSENGLKLHEKKLPKNFSIHLQEK